MPQPAAPPATGPPHDRRVVLQAGFGQGQSFLHTWQAWRDDPQRPARLDFIAIERSPPDAQALRDTHRASTVQALADELAARWPSRTRNLHRLAFVGGRVHLLLAFGNVLDWLPELQAQVHAFLIDAVDLSADAQGGTQRLCKALARLAAPRASLVASVAPQRLRPSLRSAGFQLEACPSAQAIAPTAPVTRAVYCPGFVSRHRVRPASAAGERHALIVGAGLAGCATACALAEQGWRSTLIDRCDGPAQEGSGNPAGLFHGIVNAQDGAHARFNRAAALQASLAVQQAIDLHGAKGGLHGLLRLHTAGQKVSDMRAMLAGLQLPPDYVQALDAAQASARCGVRVDHPAWFYPGGGWVQPAALARSFLSRAGGLARFRGSLQVHALRRSDGLWQLLDAAGQVIDQAATLVLANAADAMRLLDAAHWPVETVRGQISLHANATVAPGLRLQLPRMPLAGEGYLLPDVDGLALFGASSQPGDHDRNVRQADHVFNLVRLQRLSPQSLPVHAELSAAALQGRVGWRCVVGDRLPLIGAVPDGAAMASTHTERIRDVPRRAGLYVFSALASRGISWAALGSQVLAAQISGAPWPLESSLTEALDPARFVLRAARRPVPRG